jgi:hypothetical protein
MIFAVLATGPSMSQALADRVRGRCKVIAVSDSWQLAPWADALVGTDQAWWREKEPEFDGPKFTLGTWRGVETVRDLVQGSNSGLLGIHIAVKMGATKVLLLGVDLHGTHFFGPHTKLRNTPPERTAAFHGQFANYRPRGVQIFNCNPASRLTCYPMANLEDHLEGMAEPAAPGIGSVAGVHAGAEATRLHRRVRMHASTRRQGHSGVVESNPGSRASG